MEKDTFLEGLRRILHEPPSHAQWDILWSYIRSDCPEDLRQIAIDYAQQHLTAWPDEMRRLPYHPYGCWSFDTFYEKWPALMSLGRVLDLQAIPLHDTDVVHYLESPWLSHLKRIDLHYDTYLSSQNLARLLDVVAPDALVAMDLENYQRHTMEIDDARLCVRPFAGPAVWEGDGGALLEEHDEYRWRLTLDHPREEEGSFTLKGSYEHNRGYQRADYAGTWRKEVGEEFISLTLHVTTAFVDVDQVCKHKKCEAFFRYNSMFAGIDWRKCTRTDCADYIVPGYTKKSSRFKAQELTFLFDAEDGDFVHLKLDQEGNHFCFVPEYD